MLENTITTVQVESLTGKIMINEEPYQISITNTTISCYANLSDEGNMANINVNININTKKSSVYFNNISSIDTASLVAKQIENQLLLIIAEIGGK